MPTQHTYFPQGKYLFLLFFLTTPLFAQPIPGLDRIIDIFETSPDSVISSGYGIGDINNDGFDDFMAGKAGRTAIYYGGASIDRTVDLWIPNGVPRGYADLNGDGDKDFIIFNGKVTNDDSVFIYFGGAVFDTIPDVLIPPDTSIAEVENFGSVLHVGGDLNNDGYNDLIIGVQQADASPILRSTGSVHIYYGGPLLDTAPDHVFVGDTTSSSLGRSVSSGDINGDEWDDLVVSGAFQGGSIPVPDSLRFDYVNIYLGHENQDYNEPDYQLKRYRTGSHLDWQGFLATTFDYNADGYADVISGNGYIYWGAADFDTTADVYIANPFSRTLFNVSANIGDINNDGFDDLGFGLPLANNNSGLAIFYLGGPNANMTNTPDAGATPLFNTNFGSHLSPVGDVNNDGNLDILVNEPCCGGSSLTVFSGDSTLSPMTGISPFSAPATTSHFNLTTAPNPFNGAVRIRFQLRRQSNINLKVFDIQGRYVTTLKEDTMPAGEVNFTWNVPITLGSGFYFLHLQAESQKETRRILYIK